THNLTAGVSLSGGGTLEFSNDTVNISASNAALVSGTVLLDGGLVNVSGNISAGAFTQSGGTLTGSGTVTVWGLMTWTGGNMTGPGATNANGGLLVSFGGGSPMLDGRTLDNAGSATQTSTDSGAYSNLNVADGGVINNLAGATWTFANDASIYQGSGAAG